MSVDGNILKLEISKFRGVEVDSLLRWCVEVDGAIESRRIDYERMQVSFDQSYLGGDAYNWALNPNSHDPNVWVVNHLQGPAQQNL